MNRSITYRLVSELFRSQAEPGAMNVSIDLCNLEDGTLSVGPHPGFGDNVLVVAINLASFAGGRLTEVAFNATDSRPARQLADALLAWADYIDALEGSDDA